ncbi:T9SS type A sorting domain-containing protein [Hymenobacter sp. BT664]|uniref:T9SS type A sorting domain-containing protein n=1 Tax=Hymenobacter montanus TaxID=2771359 RepID=A0A927BBE9_9BACT|nr:T9SS type A sorting domain-containing protein [Hymenobacter montanus]MBD2767205.1 T9SS type A sorting domain-containing protein [Hymenobacter montanus]
MQPLEPASRAQQSALVVEAQVFDAQGFWDASHRRLFTRHRLRVFALLKGQVADTTGLVLITEGGRVGLDQQILTNTLRLVPGQQGVFFLTPAPWRDLPTTPGRAWTPFGSEQGFIQYNLAERTASEPFRRYPALDAAFYAEISQFTGQSRQVLQANPALGPVSGTAHRGTLAPLISGFTPQTLPSGAGAVLTINGSGFGNSRGSGSVEFRNADDGGATRVQVRNADYLSWTDTQIQVRVPSAASGGLPVSGGHPAGSGPVRVTTSDQQTAETADRVTIIYALTNVENTDGTLVQRPNHIAQNSSGGITFLFGPNLAANAAAAASWRRALNTWRCQTGMNWEVGPPATTNAIGDDGRNVVAFDAGPELPARVLGRTTSYYRGCYDADNQVVFWVNEIDMQFDDNTLFQFGPAPAVGALNQTDFETVAVHELGHAQQLNHLILPGAVMHYAIARGQNTRALNPASDVVGGRQVLRVRSFKNLGCGKPALLPAPLTSFNAQFAAGVGVTLTWATRDECLLSGFVVERSAGADTTAWVQLGTITPLPATGQYQFLDASNPEGLLYYRLRLIRPDGSRDAVAPIVLTTEGGTAAFIFPNPVSGNQLLLQYPAGVESTLVFRFYDVLGRQIRTTRASAVAGLNVFRLDVAGLAPGLYVLRWQDAQGGTGSRKFVRQ